LWVHPKSIVLREVEDCATPFSRQERVPLDFEMWDSTIPNSQVLYQGAAFSRAEKGRSMNRGFSP
jgi:hypothetical protein